jgi:cobalamin biosynthesis protein CobT
MARRIVNRMDKRVEHDAWERRTDEEEPVEGEEEAEEGEEEEGEEEEGDEEEAGDEEAEEGDGDDDEEAPKKKKAVKPKPKAKPKAKPRTRTVKTTRMRVVWGVFNNSHQMVATYEYPKKPDAEAHAAKLTAEKRSTHFVQPVKEPIEEKKE